MAIQLATFVTGKLGDVVHFKRNGKHISRSIPVHLKHTPATKIRSRNFGVAASTGRVLREQLSPVLLFPKDKRMQSRFSGAIAKWLALNDPATIPAMNDIPVISQFSFSEDTAMDTRWKLRFNMLSPSPGNIELQLPSFIPTQRISAPAYTAQVDCTITVAGCNLTGIQQGDSHTIQFIIPYTDISVAAQSISFPVSTAAGRLVIAVASLRYYFSNGQADQRKVFLPSSVVGAMWF